MIASWEYPATAPKRVQGRGLAEDNFAQQEESKTPLSILIREAIQNPLDARIAGHEGPVRIRLGIFGAGEFDRDYLKTLLPDEYFKRLESAGGDPGINDFESCNVLVMEDFGTTGLLGSTDDPNTDGDTQNWNAFWFREGEGAKAGGSNGRAGQGKITYYRVGRARAIFGLTVRSDDGRKLLMGRSSFRRVYPYGDDGRKYERDSFWCLPGDDRALPVEDTAEIERFCKAFHLKRNNDPGFSLVIPFSEKIDIEEAVRTVIAEFYYPIARRRLEVTIASCPPIRKDNIDSLAETHFSDEHALHYPSSFTRGFRAFIQDVIADETSGKTPVIVASNWKNTPVMTEAVFPAGTLEGLRTAFDRGERVSVRFPILVRHKKKDPAETYFDVHVQLPEDLERVQEAYLRRDLLIGLEAQLKDCSYLPKARGVTLIEDDVLSAFMADAEEPTHLKWNGSRPRLAEDYIRPPEIVTAVRRALPRLLTFLTGSSPKRDAKALAKFFSKPLPEGRKTPAPGEKPGVNTGEKVTPPEKAAKPFRLETDQDWIRVAPNRQRMLTPAELPVKCTMELAYEGVDLDPFSAYDPFDFEVSDNTVHQVSTVGITVISRKQNVVEFDVLQPEFRLDINGFDQNIRLRARLDYMEKPHGAAVDQE